MLWDKAEELGRLIGQANECKALRRSETELRDDADTRARLERIQTLAREVDALVARGEAPEPATVESYETAVRDLETSPIGQAYVVARANFEKLMVKVNERISEGIEKGATSSIITLG
ncbi:MAG: YlbF family regulator [Gemmatimonadales bacterium]